MGTGYTRNDTDNNIADGNVINAADFDGEFDAIVTAFSTSGHTHDGTSAEGGPVSVVGPAQDITVSATIVSPKSNNAIDLGTDALEFKDIYIAGSAFIEGFGRDMLVATDKKVQFRDTAIFINSSTDGQLDIDADTELEITAPTVDINASTVVTISNDLKLDSDSAVLGFGADNDTTLTHTDGTGLTLNSTNKLTFGDAASFVQQSSDGTLRIDGEAIIDLNASTRVDVSGDLKVGDDLSLASDSAVLSFGADSEITVTHVADTGLTITNTNTGDNKPIVIQLKSEENEITANEVIGSIEFAAGDDSGTDAATVAAGIHAIAEAEFTSSVNSTKLVFTTGASETAAASATAKMTLSSTGDLTIADDLFLDSDNAVLSFGDDGDTTLTHTDGSGLTLNSTNKIMFNDASQFIQGSSGTVLSLGATDEIDLTATAIDINGTLDVSGSAVFNTSVEVVTSDNSTQLTLKSTDADASVGPVMVFERESASAASDDEIGRILFVGRNAENNADVNYGSIETHISAAAAASAGGYMKFRVASHDGETQSGLEIRDGDAEDEVDVTIGSGTGSITNVVGALGVGTSSPTGIHSLAKVLEISGGDGGDLIIGNNASTNIGAGAHVGAIAFKNIDSSTGSVPHYAGIRSEAADTSGNMDLRFYTGIGNLEADTPQVIIDENGNVGIGTTSPKRLLHINGGSESVKLQITNSTTGSSSDGDGFQIGIATNGTANIEQRENAGLNITTNNTTRMTIDASGNVGIGTGTDSITKNLEIRTDSGDEGILVKSTGDTSNEIAGDANRSSADAALLGVTGKWNGTSVAQILFQAGADTTNKDDGFITFRTSSADNIAENMRIDSSGNVSVPNGAISAGLSAGSQANDAQLTLGAAIPAMFFHDTTGGQNDAAIQVENGQIRFLTGANGNNVSDLAQKIKMHSGGDLEIVDGDLIIGTAGHGIDFSAQTATSASGATTNSEVLDHYEEGTFTPSVGSASGSGGSAGSNVGRYTRIGNRVFADFSLSVSSVGSMSGNFFIVGFPFASNSTFIQSQGAVRSQGLGGSNDIPVVFEMVNGNSFGRFHFQSGSNSQRTVQVSDVSANDFICASISYIV